MSSTGQSPNKSGLPSRLALYAVLAVLAVCCGALTAVLVGAGGGGEAKIAGTRDEPAAASRRLATFASPLPAPDLTFVDAEGRQHRLSDWQGKVVLVNLWATWCAPCKAEMPSLDRLQARLGGDRFSVIAISTDRGGPDRPAAFFSKEGISHLTLFSDRTSNSTSILGASGLPLSILVDEHGREVARLLGPANWDNPQSAAKIEELLRPGKASG